MPVLTGDEVISVGSELVYKVTVNGEDIYQNDDALLAEQTVFLHLNGVDKYAQASDIVMSGDFNYKIKIKFDSITAASQYQGAHDDNRMYFGIRPTTGELFVGSGANFVELLDFVALGHFYSVEIRKRGSDYQFYVDEVLRYTGVGDATRTTFPVYLGCSSNSAGSASGFINGTVASVEWEDLADSNSVLWTLDSSSTVSEDSEPAGNPATYNNIVAGDWYSTAISPIASNTFTFHSGAVNANYFFDASTLFTGGEPDTITANGTFPAGLSIDETTGYVTGLATTEESQNISFTGTNIYGNDTTNTASLVIEAETAEMRPILPLQIDTSNPLASGLLGAYRANADTAAATWIDATGNAANGAITGAELAYLGETEKWALSFDGANDWVNIASSDFDVPNLSISARIKGTSTDSSLRLFAAPTSYTHEHIVISNQGKIACSSNAASEDIHGYNTPVNNEFFSFTALPNLRQIMHDGITSGDYVAGSHSKGGGNFRIGAKQDGSGDWTGLMKYAYFHNRHLTQAEADSLAADPDQIYIREVGIEAGPPLADAGIFTHSDAVSASLLGVYDRPITEYEFAGGSNGFIEATTDGVIHTQAGWNMDTQTYYGSQYADILSVNDATRGRSLFTEPSGPDNTLPVSSAWNGVLEYFFNAPVPENTKIRISYMTKGTRINPSDPNSVQWKIWRIRADEPGLNMAQFKWYNSGDSIDYEPKEPESGIVYGMNQPNMDEWTKVVIEILTSTQNVEDGEFHVSWRDSNGLTIGQSNSDTFGPWPKPIMTYGDTARYEFFTPQNFLGHYQAGESIEIGMDDMSIAIDSWCSVEITNNIVYSLGTIAEEQEVISWTDDGTTTTIQYRLNEGGLPPGNYYEHIRDDDGNVISTREIEIT